MPRRPTWNDLRRFCERQQFAHRSGDHDFYDKRLALGVNASTKISHGKTTEQISANLWGNIWKRQLRLANEDEFWRGLAGDFPRYDVPPIPTVAEPLPDYLRQFLTDVLHYDEMRIAATDRETAQRLLNAHYSGQL